MEQYNRSRVYGISGMRYEGKLGKCRHYSVRKLVGFLVLVEKSNNEENYNTLPYGRVIEGIGKHTIGLII